MQHHTKNHCRDSIGFTLTFANGTLLYIVFMHLGVALIIMRCGSLRRVPCGCKHCRPQVLWQLALKKSLTLLVQLLGHLLRTLNLLSHSSKDNTITGANTCNLEPYMRCTCSSSFLFIGHMHYEMQSHRSIHKAIPAVIPMSA